MSAGSPIDPDQPLLRHPEFVVQGMGVAADTITAPNRPTVHSTQAARVMAAFTHARTFREVSAELADQLGTAGAWMAAMDCIRDCFAAGILVAAEQPLPRNRPRGFAREGQHVAMLDDTIRTRSFIDALQATVGPDDIVLDIGTGTGVLAMAAARAGAAHVYAVESSAMFHVAAAGVRANGLTDQITVIHGHSAEITLPERATVVVGEIIGDDPFDESILPTFADAARRLATPGAHFIPQSLSPVLVPLRLSAAIFGQIAYTKPATDQWTAEYGIDFSWLLAPDIRATSSVVDLAPRLLTEAVCGPSITLPAVNFPDPRVEYSATAWWPGVPGANAMGVAFLSSLTEEISLTNSPAASPRANSWGVMVWVPHHSDLARPGRINVQTARGLIQIHFDY